MTVNDECDNYITKTLALLEELFSRVDIQENPFLHGVIHAKRVAEHVRVALQDRLEHIDTRMDCIMAALLHDADDSKVFVSKNDEDNALRILRNINYPSDRIMMVLRMIDNVSYSKNGINSTFHDGFIERESIWDTPRDADRLEALGLIGIARCIRYGELTGRPLYLETTPRYHSKAQIYQHALRCTILSLYPDVPRPSTTIDYFYNGLINRGLMTSKIQYFYSKASQLIKPIFDFLLFFTKTLESGNETVFTMEHVIDFIKGYPHATEEERAIALHVLVWGKK